MLDVLFQRLPKSMKLKTVYSCQNCSFQTSKWLGKCPSCDEWNSFVEDVINVGKTETKRGVVRPLTTEKPQKIITEKKAAFRTQTNIAELDAVLGGGFVEGSLTLLSGEPGIGKSTLTLQIVEQMAAKKGPVLYVTGEGSVEQGSDRARRLNCRQNDIELWYETNLEAILAMIESKKPAFLVVDSIQVIASSEILGSAGSVSQVRYGAELLMNANKTPNIPTLWSCE